MPSLARLGRPRPTYLLWDTNYVCVYILSTEEERKPADLSQRVIFKRRQRPDEADQGAKAVESSEGCEKPRKKKEAPKPRPIVSFDDDCDDE